MTGGIRRELLIDGALGAAVSLVVAVAIAADLGGNRPPDLVAYLFAVGLGALMLVRRRFPVLALAATSVGLVAYYVAGYPAIGLAIPVAAALYSAAEAGRLAAAVLAAGALLLLTTGWRLYEGDDPAYLLGFETAWTIGLMGGAIALGDGVRARRLLRAEREAAAGRRVQEERLRIARDLHDVLAHTVAVVSVQASVADEALTEDPDAARAALSVIRTATDEAVRDLRATIGLLRGSGEAEPRAPAGSLRHLAALVDATTESGLAVEVVVEGEPVPLPAVVDATAYRIVQESLANCLRHAQASRAEVTLRYTAEQLAVRITDDGTGAAVNGSPGRGIRGMRERAALLGGRVEVGSRPGAGFRVDASLPLRVEP